MVDDAAAEAMRETRLRGRRVFEGKLLTLDVDTVRVPTGVDAVREVIRHPGAVVVVPVLDDGRVLMVRQYRYAVDAVVLELPAGKLDAGEDPAACAARELAEETGHRPGVLRPLGVFHAAPGFSDETLHAFFATDMEPATGAAPDADEIIEAVIFSLEDVRSMVAAGEIHDAKTLAAICLADAKGLL